MISALWYLQFHSVRNRLLFRLKRLRQPKYLFGAIVGGLYFYFYLFRYAPGFHRHGAARYGMADPLLDVSFLESFGALALLTILLLGWFFPRERAALAFSEAEVAFLFPAPVTRRGLINFKLARSQMAIFFGSIVLMAVTRRAGGHAWIRALGWWVILSTVNLHLLGASFARTILFDRGITNWRRRCIIISVVALAVTGIALWVRHALPQLAPPRDISDLKDYARQVFETVPVKALLFPWRLVVRPFLSTDATTFALAFLPALAVLGFHYVWVTGSDVAFEEASIAASERLAQKIAAIRSGNWREAGRKLKRKRAPFELRPHGFPFVAFVWKNLISVGQGFSPRVWVTLAVSAICVCAAFGRSANTGWGVMVAAIAGMLLAWTLLLGPQFMRQDFRQDLAQVDLLKSFPLPGWQIALGEVLAPALVLAGAQWILLFLTVCLLPSSLIHGLTLWTRASIGLSLAVLLPALDLLLLQIPNAAVLLFPAWFQPGKSGPQGIEVSGQRIILMIGSLTALVIGILPAAAAFAGIFFVSSLAFSPLASAALAAFAAAAVILAEATAGMMLLGWLLGRFDSSAELNP